MGKQLLLFQESVKKTAQNRHILFGYFYEIIPIKKNILIF